MEKKKGALFIILIVIIFIVILFMPNIYKYLNTKPVPKVEDIKEEKEEKIEKLTLDSDIVKNLKYPIMRYGIYNKNSYYEKSSFKVTDLTNEEVLINAFVDIYSGNINDYKGLKPSCAVEAKELKTTYISSRIRNILSNDINYTYSNFNVPELPNYSKYLGEWKYNSQTDTYIYYGTCNKESGIKYYDLKVLNKLETKNNNKELIIYAYMAFASVNNNKYTIYSDVSLNNKILEGNFTTLENLNKDFKNYLKNNKTKQYKFIFKKGICSYGDYCLAEGVWE